MTDVRQLDDEVISEEELTMNHQHKINIKTLMKLVKSYTRGYISDKEFKEKLNNIQNREVVGIIEALRRGPDEFGAYVVRKPDGAFDYAFKFVVNPHTYEFAFGRQPQNLSVTGYYSVEINKELLPLMYRVFIFDEKRQQRFGGVSYRKVHRAEYFTVAQGKIVVVETKISQLRRDLE